MKILFFLRRIGPYHHARFEAAAKGITLVAVETRPGTTEYPWLFQRPGDFVVEKFPISEDPETGIRGPVLKRTLHQLFDKHNPDVVVTTGWADPEYHAAVLEANSRKLPCVVISDSRHEDESRKFYKEFIKRLILKSYSAAIVAGVASREYMLRLGFPAQAIFQPWDVVDNNYFASASSTAAFESRYFLCVSRFIPKKNLERLLAGYSGYVKNGGRRKLLLLGSGELETRLRQISEELGLKGFLETPGFMQYDALRSCYADAFCLILPSLTDQWGLVVNEAMAAGLPVAVSANCGCASDLIVESQNGFIFDPFKTEDMKGVLVKADSLDEIEWRRMGDTSRHIIKKWGLSDFASALGEAARYASSAHRPGTLSLLHKALAR
jgi:1,2-diacylglycerol 3-alpha-glucosyltransferase